MSRSARGARRRATPRRVLALLGPASALMLVALFLPPPVGPALFALLAAAFPVGLIAVGAARNGRLGPLAWPLGVLLVVLEGAMVALLALRGRLLELPWVGGLPLSAALQLYGLGLLPLLLVVLGYGLTFERFTLTEEDLRRLRDVTRRAEPGAGGGSD